MEEIEVLENENNHGMFIFAKGNSSGLNSDDTVYDYSFPTPQGRVSYILKEDGEYLVSCTPYELHPPVELDPPVNRSMSFEILSAWFYSPTDQYFEDIISKIEIIEAI